MFGCFLSYAHRTLRVILNGLSLADAFRRYVLNDPEVAALGKRVVKTTKQHADVFRDGMFPRPLDDFHWPLDATAESIEYSFTPQSSGVDDWLPTPSAMISAVSAVLADRIQGLRNVLASGSICAFGTSQTGIEGPIGRFQWLRSGILILTSSAYQARSWGVVKSLELIGSGPVGLVHRQKVRFFQKKNPTASP
jgi:hypothetical protein